jgi:hypothetical protein
MNSENLDGAQARAAIDTPALRGVRPGGFIRSSRAAGLRRNRVARDGALPNLDKSSIPFKHSGGLP